MFYILGSQELQPKKPMWPPSSPPNCPPLTSSCRPKFLTVKFVIFFSFWQSVVLAILAHYVSSLLAAAYIYTHTHTHLERRVNVCCRVFFTRRSIGCAHMPRSASSRIPHTSHTTHRTSHIAHLTFLSSLFQSVENISTGIQNFLICVEMLVSSIAFRYAFPASDYLVLNDSQQPMSTNVFRSFVHIANPCDILDEVRVAPVAFQRACL
jgi:hypothetical protein